MFLVLLLAACGSDEPAWAVAHASVVPTTSGIEGVQGWSFFTKRWGKASGDAAFVCTRAQSFTGTVVAGDSGCEGCLVAYDVEYTEMGSDCPEDIAADPAYQLPPTMGIGDVPDDYADLNPEEERAYGWYADIGGETMEPYGFAWDDALDWGGDPGPPGWNVGQAYALTSFIAWDLTGG